MTIPSQRIERQQLENSHAVAQTFQAVLPHFLCRQSPTISWSVSVFGRTRSQMNACSRRCSRRVLPARRSVANPSVTLTAKLRDGKMIVLKLRRSVETIQPPFMDALTMQFFGMHCAKMTTEKEQGFYSWCFRSGELVLLLLSPSLLLVLFFLSSQKWIDAQRFLVSGGRNERHDGGYHLHQCEYCSKGLMPAKEDAGSNGSDHRVTEFARYSQSLKDPSILRDTAAILCVTTKHQHRMLIATSLEQFFWQRFTWNKKGSLKCFAISAVNLNGSKSQSNPRRYEPIL